MRAEVVGVGLAVHVDVLLVLVEQAHEDVQVRVTVRRVGEDDRGTCERRRKGRAEEPTAEQIDRQHQQQRGNESREAPQKRDNFPETFAAFAQARHYSDWKFSAVNPDTTPGVDGPVHAANDAPLSGRRALPRAGQ